VSRVSADITQDQTKGTSFYTVRLMLPDSEIARLNGLKLVPGMPVEAFIQTGDRTAISYLIKPISDQLVARGLWHVYIRFRGLLGRFSDRR
jgi:HlyD family secretion protein